VAIPDTGKDLGINPASCLLCIIRIQGVVTYIEVMYAPATGIKMKSSDQE